MRPDESDPGIQNVKMTDLRFVPSLPKYVYWLLPQYLILAPVANLIILFSEGIGFFPIWSVVFVIIESVLVGIPIFVAFVRLWHRWMVKFEMSFNPMVFVSFFVGIVMVFKLNPDLSARHPWFKYCYYGSFILFPIITFVGLGVHILFILCKSV